MNKGLDQMALDATRDVVAVPRSRGWLLLMLSVLMAFASISTDVYLPAIPAMARSLDAPVGTMELTISGYLVGFSLGQLVWGVLSDRYGRRWPIMLGLGLFVLGSVGCALAQTAWGLISWRLIQALGACASVVLARAMVRDCYAGAAAARMLSALMMVMAIAPLLGPLVGGEILLLAGWRSIFWGLAGVGVATIVGVFSLPETLPLALRHPQSLTAAFKSYAQLLADPRLLSYMAAGGFYYAAMFAYIAGSPFAYISYHHVSPRGYACLFAAGIIGVMLANMLNRRWVAKYGSDWVLWLGARLAAVGGVLSAGTALTGWGGLLGLVLALWLVAAAAGLIVANAIAGAMTDHPRQAGAVSALVGAFQYGFGVVSSGLLGVLDRRAGATPAPLAVIIVLSTLACLAAVWSLRRAKTAVQA